MNIGNTSVFMGVYTERLQSRLSHTDFRTQVSDARQQEVQQKVTEKAAEAMREIKSRRDIDSVSISKEGREFLCSEAGYEKMKADTEEFLNGLFTGYTQQQEKLQQNNSDDPFWGSTGNQWLVFSKKLYDNGFYDKMTDEEVKQTENILDKITGGMDGFGRAQYGIGLNIDAYMEAGESSGSGFNLLAESGELWTELESSTAALKYFAENYIQDEELKKEFKGLAEQYYAHNSEQLDGYQSLSEKMKHSSNEEETKQYRDQVSLLFQQLGQGTSGWEEAWKKIENSYVNYAVKGSDNQSVRDSAAAQAETMFQQMKGYWSLLAGGNSEFRI